MLLRFSIRDLIWLTLVVAFAAAWWVERTRAIKTVEQLTVSLAAAETRLHEAEDLLEFEGVVMQDGSTIHTTPEHAAELRKLNQSPGGQQR